MDNETYHLTNDESPTPSTQVRPVPILLQEPPLQICGLRHPHYNAEGGARRCAWIHLVGALVAFICAGILGYRGAGMGWPLASGLVFLVTAFAGFTACIYRLTLTILISMISCLISASFSIIMILWAVFSIINFVTNDLDDRTLKLILSIHVILGVCGIAELITDIIHAVKAIRIICCFRDEKYPIKRQGSRLVQTPSLRMDQRPSSLGLVIGNPSTEAKKSVFV